MPSSGHRLLLPSLPRVYPRRQISPEEKKFEIRHDRLTAFYTGLIHLLPISATIVLVYLNWRGYYIGGELADFGWSR